MIKGDGAFLECLPQGFHTATDLLNGLPVKVVVDMCEKIIQYTLNIGYGCTAEEVKEMLEKSFDIERSVEDLQNVLNVLRYIFRTAFNHKIDVKRFSLLLRARTQINNTIKKVIGLQYQKFSAKNIETQEKSFQLSRLREIDWKIGVSIASKHCRKLHCGKVTLSFLLDSENESHRERHTVELTLDQFRELYKHFNDMKEIMDTL